FLGMSTDISLWFLVMMGLPNALHYAGIWPLAINGLGRFTNLGSAFLVMALSGSAIMPIVYNSFFEMNSVSLPAFESMKNSYAVLIPCFAFIVWYSIWGYKIKTWKRVKYN